MIVYQTGPEFTTGGQRRVVVEDDQSRGLLDQILKELKTMNVYNSLITDEELKQEDGGL